MKSEKGIHPSGGLHNVWNNARNNTKATISMKAERLLTLARGATMTRIIQKIP